MYMIEGHRMNNDDLQHKIIATLDQKARHHHNRHQVMENVFVHIEQKRHERFNRWGITGFALAAAITGIVVVPNGLIEESQQQQQISVSTPKLTPQLVDDLEMLLVLGEDIKHGR